MRTARRPEHLHPAELLRTPDIELTKRLPAAGPAPEGETIPQNGNRERAGGALTGIRLLHPGLVVRRVVHDLSAVRGFAKRSDRRAAIAGAVVIAECTVFLANGLRCLTIVLHLRNLRR
ncbi:hypothetical protein AB0F52_09275 [Amycolatopsis sp. NPDC024027]|uniref:hypothetical protein n=1 Tax=Amycolatopsis sp. NPDC024027 TaxID=3154327 RepID=UPI0033CB10C5